MVSLLAVANASADRRALLVGINRYRHLTADRFLRGAVRDAEAMADLLERRFGFSGNQLRLLCDEAATRQAVVEALEGLVSEVGPGSVVVVHWSGHGSQLAAEPAGGGEGQGPDETLVPHDARDGKVGDLRDKEVQLYLSRLSARGACVTWIADSCHSGHLHRLAQYGRARSIPSDTALAPAPRPTPAAGDHAARPFDALPHHQRYALLAACRRHQEAFERPLFAGDSHGEWTFALLKTLHECAADATVREVGDVATASLLAAGVPQLPRVVGARDRLIFGVEARRPVRYVEVRQRTGSRVELAAGLAQGLVEGSEWSAYPARTYEPTPADAAERLRIVRVGALSSEAEVLPAAGGARRHADAGDWAYEDAPAYGELQQAVRLVGATAGPQWDVLHRRIEECPVLRLASTAEEDSVTVELAEDRLLVADTRGVPLLPPLRAGDPSAPEAIVDRLTRRARWRHGLRLENRDPSSRLRACLRARLLRRGAEGTWRAAGPWVAGSRGGASASPLPVFHCGDPLALEVCHRCDSDLFVYVLDFGAGDYVTQLFPPPGGEELPLAPRARLPVGTLAGDGFELWLPDDSATEDGAAGLIKVYATTHPTDFDWLRTDVRWPARRRADATSLTRLLAMGTAGPLLRQTNEDWGTVMLSLWLQPPRRSGERRKRQAPPAAPPGSSDT